MYLPCLHRQYPANAIHHIFQVSLTPAAEGDLRAAAAAAAAVQGQGHHQRGPLQQDRGRQQQPEAQGGDQGAGGLGLGGQRVLAFRVPGTVG